MPLKPTKYLFGGIVNRHDPADGRGVYDSNGKLIGFAELSLAQNVDFTDRGGCRRRPGVTEQVTGNAHSFYGTRDAAYYVEDSAFKLFPSGSSLLSLSSDAPMAYEPCADALACSNDSDFFLVVDGVAAPSVTPTERFKIKTPPGRHLAYFNGRLYVATKDGIAYTDPYNLDVCDERAYLIPMSGITMLGAVAGGLYVGHVGGTVFLRGTGPEDFVYVPLLDTAPIDSAYTVEDADDAGIQAQGRVILFATEDGLYVGNGAGEVKNLGDDKVAYPKAKRGSVAVRHTNGQAHIVVSLQEPESADVFAGSTLSVTTTDYR